MTSRRSNAIYISKFSYMLLFFVLSAIVLADGYAQTVTKDAYSSGPYCGVSCLYSVMKLYDMDIAFRDLLKPEYVGSWKGSSLKELNKAAKDNGLYAKSVKNLTRKSLMASIYPVILHTKSTDGSKEYDHFELFLGTEAAKAKLFDPPKPVSLVPFYELVPRWDGTGLIVSTEPIELGKLFAPAQKRFLLWSTVAIGVILVLRWAKRRWLKMSGELARPQVFGLSVAQGAAFIVMALVFGMVYHFANDAGFLARANATTSVQQAHLGSFIPKISSKKVAKLINSDAVIIDARYARDYKSGHLEGAISVPINANDTQRQQAMAGIAKDSRIVVYCQSAGCPFAEKVTKKLKADSFSNISIYKGGWNDWQAKSN